MDRLVISFSIGFLAFKHLVRPLNSPGVLVADQLVQSLQDVGTPSPRAGGLKTCLGGFGTERLSAVTARTTLLQPLPPASPRIFNGERHLDLPRSFPSSQEVSILSTRRPSTSHPTPPQSTSYDQEFCVKIRVRAAAAEAESDTSHLMTWRKWWSPSSKPRYR